MQLPSQHSSTFIQIKFETWIQLKAVDSNAIKQRKSFEENVNRNIVVCNFIKDLAWQILRLFFRRLFYFVLFLSFDEMNKRKPKAQNNRWNKKKRLCIVTMCYQFWMYNSKHFCIGYYVILKFNGINEIYALRIFCI